MKRFITSLLFALIYADENAETGVTETDPDAPEENVDTQDTLAAENDEE